MRLTNAIALFGLALVTFVTAAFGQTAPIKPILPRAIFFNIVYVKLA